MWNILPGAVWNGLLRGPGDGIRALGDGIINMDACMWLHWQDLHVRIIFLTESQHQTYMYM